MSSASVFYYILSKEAEEKRNIVEGAENIADDLRRLMAGKA
jgi:ribosome-binding factor A